MPSSPVNQSGLEISLPPHLVDALMPLPALLPLELADQLRPYLVDPPPSSIPYNTLNAISKWSRSEKGQHALSSHTPPLHVHDYSMISLLAGARTSPNGKFGDYTPKKEPEEEAADRVKERKSITALVNALLSIGGAGFATWWAADKTGWKNEWKVLLALLVAIVVAVAEAGLYLIWYSRRSESKPKRRTYRVIASARHKKEDVVSEVYPTETTVVKDATDKVPTLRQRR